MESLKKFLQFLKTTWGVLSLISITFPLATNLLNVVPLPSGSEEVTLALTTVVCIFFIYFSFILLNLCLSIKNNKFIINIVLFLFIMLSVPSFIFGLHGFLEISNSNYEYEQEKVGRQSIQDYLFGVPEPDPPTYYKLLPDEHRFTYILSSLSFTASFTFLGMFQYLRQESYRPLVKPRHR